MRNPSDSLFEPQPNIVKLNRRWPLALRLSRVFTRKATSGLLRETDNLTQTDPDGNGQVGSWLSAGDAKFQFWSQEEDAIIQLVCSYVPLFLCFSMRANNPAAAASLQSVTYLSPPICAKANTPAATNIHRLGCADRTDIRCFCSVVRFAGDGGRVREGFRRFVEQKYLNRRLSLE